MLAAREHEVDGVAVDYTRGGGFSMKQSGNEMQMRRGAVEDLLGVYYLVIPAAGSTTFS